MSFWDRLPRPIVGLAPMDGVTDATFRRVVACSGKPDITFTEFTHVNDICRAPEFLLDSLIYTEAERPIVAQIYGRDPELFYVAAQVVGALGFDGLDINMGCPSRSVANSGSGAGLIRTPDLAREILDAARRGLDDWAMGAALPVTRLRSGRTELVARMNTVRAGDATVARRPLPLSVKTRLGYDSDVIDWWMDWLLASHPAAITVHGRTLAQMYRGQADWSAIARAAVRARGTGTLVLGNGDVQSLADARRRIAETGVDGVLVGRSALGEPWFFRELSMARAAWSGESVASRTGADTFDPVADRPMRIAAMLEHARVFEAVGGRARFQHIRKHLGWYCKEFPHAAVLRGRLVRASSVDDVLQIVETFDREFVAGDAAPSALDQSASGSLPAVDTPPASACVSASLSS
ncbi:MAG: tRNA-dihydrouridine synthase [Nitrospiraceae bacterium]